VRDRSGGRCEYCLLPQQGSRAPFRDRPHHHLTGLDSATGKITRLYHPRPHKWAYHFRFQGSTLIGGTAIGRTTIDVFQMNHPEIVPLRDILMAAAIF
jgi:hypothetical protein